MMNRKLKNETDFDFSSNRIYTGDAKQILATFPDCSVDCCVTSPPYFNLRNYGVKGQIGLEDTPEEYIGRLMGVFEEIYRVLKKSGTLWLNIGDSYNGSGKSTNYTLDNCLQKTNKSSQLTNPTQIKGLKPKDMIGIPWLLAFTLRKSGWYLRQDIIWNKPNPMPEPVIDRCTKAHEYVFLLSKSRSYYFNHNAMLETANYDGRTKMTTNGSKKYIENSTGLAIQGLVKANHLRWANSIRGKDNVSHPARNKRDVWTIPVRPFKGAHFATFPPDLVKNCIKAGCPPDGIVLDPFFGSGTTGLVACELNRNFIGIELNPAYVEIAKQRLETLKI